MYLLGENRNSRHPHTLYAVCSNVSAFHINQLKTEDRVVEQVDRSNYTERILSNYN